MTNSSVCHHVCHQTPVETADRSGSGGQSVSENASGFAETVQLSAAQPNSAAPFHGCYRSSNLRGDASQHRADTQESDGSAAPVETGVTDCVTGPRNGARGYRYTALGVSGWVRARSRGRARFLIAAAIREAGYERRVIDALRAITALRLDPRADGAPVLGVRDDGLVPTTWAPSAGGAP